MQKPSTSKIAISGELGSGKSTVASLLGKRLGISVVSTGAFQRELAHRKGLTTLELNQLAERDASIDAEIDAINGEIEHSNVSTIVDSRMGWKFVPSAFKIFLAVDEELAAERIFADTRNAEDKYSSIQTARQANRARRQSEITRFQITYGVDIGQWENFDLVINTNVASPEEIVEAIVDHMNQRPNERKQTIYLTSPKSCFPTERDSFRHIPDAAITVPGGVLPMVDLVCVRGTNLIWGSHFEVADAILTKRAFIQGRVVARENLQLPNQLSVIEWLKLMPSLSTLYDWEEALGFKFYRYPHWYSQ